jgi:hypothetical protein
MLLPSLEGSKDLPADRAIDWMATLAAHDRWLRTVVLARLREQQAVEEVMQEVALAAIAQRAPLQALRPGRRGARRDAPADRRYPAGATRHPRRAGTTCRQPQGGRRERAGRPEAKRYPALACRQTPGERRRFDAAIKGSRRIGRAFEGSPHGEPRTIQVRPVYRVKRDRAGIRSLQPAQAGKSFSIGMETRRMGKPPIAAPVRGRMPSREVEELVWPRVAALCVLLLRVAPRPPTKSADYNVFR